MNSAKRNSNVSQKRVQFKAHIMRLFTKNIALCKNVSYRIKCEFCPMFNNKIINCKRFIIKSLNKWRLYPESHNVAKFLYEDLGNFQTMGINYQTTGTP